MGARETGVPLGPGFLRSPSGEDSGNTTFELPEHFPASASVTPPFEFRRVFLGRDVAEHRAADGQCGLPPADHRRADAAGDVVVAPMRFNLGKMFQIQLSANISVNARAARTLAK